MLKFITDFCFSGSIFFWNSTKIILDQQKERHFKKENYYAYLETQFQLLILILCNDHTNLNAQLHQS